MIRAIVVDDENLTAEHICRLLKNECVEVVGSFNNPVEALSVIEKTDIDVLFLDIEMPEISGLELAQRVYSTNKNCEIIFITAYNQFALEAFSVSALDYLLKPITQAAINRALERVRKRKLENTAILDRKQESDYPSINISLIGKLSVKVGESEDTIRWHTSKCAEVFAHMLLIDLGREVSKWKIIENIWPDKDSKKGDINFRSTVSRINKTLREKNTGISLVSTGNSYKLLIQNQKIYVDTFEIENLALDSIEITNNNLNLYENTVFGYRDTLLEEFGSQWCEVLREIYHRYFLIIAKKLITYYQRVKADHIKILILAELIIKFEPYDESIRKIALEQHYFIGGKKRAEKYINDYRQLIIDDLGIDPSKAIYELYKILHKL